MSQRLIEYVPPSHDVLVHFAQTAGEQLGTAYADPDIVRGLADFMGLVARLLAQDLNRPRADGVDSGVE